MRMSNEMDEAGPQPPFFVVKIWLTSSKIIHTFAEVLPVSTNVGGRGRYDNTHLTIERVRGIESQHIKTYGDECAHACQGINLRGGMFNTRLSRVGETQKKRGTDPYCPPVWATPLEDAPFIIESDEELPAGEGKR